MTTIREYCAPNFQEILDLYASVGWTNYTQKPAMLESAYANSLLILGAYQGEKLVGIVRAVGDGASVVLVQDLLVRPEYQRKGVGTRLLRELLNRFSDVYQVQLLTDDTAKNNAFYRSLGFSEAGETGCRAFLRMKI